MTQHPQHPQPPRNCRRGEIYIANMNEACGSEQAGIRPVLIIQNDIGNDHAPTTIVAAITSQVKQAHLPTHVKLPLGTLERSAIVLLEQLRTIDKKARLYQCVGDINGPGPKMEAVRLAIDRALLISLGLGPEVSVASANLPAPEPCHAAR